MDNVKKKWPDFLSKTIMEEQRYHDIWEFFHLLQIDPKVLNIRLLSTPQEGRKYFVYLYEDIVFEVTPFKLDIYINQVKKVRHFFKYYESKNWKSKGELGIHLVYTHFDEGPKWLTEMIFLRKRIHNIFELILKKALEVWKENGNTLKGMCKSPRLDIYRDYDEGPRTARTYGFPSPHHSSPARYASHLWYYAEKAHLPLSEIELSRVWPEEAWKSHYYAHKNLIMGYRGIYMLNTNDTRLMAKTIEDPNMLFDEDKNKNVVQVGGVEIVRLTYEDKVAEDTYWNTTNTSIIKYVEKYLDDCLSVITKKIKQNTLDEDREARAKTEKMMEFL